MPCQAAEIGGATAEVTAKTVTGVSKQLEMAKGGTADLVKNTGSALGSVKVDVAVPEVDAGAFVSKFQAKGAAAAKKAQEQAARDIAQQQEENAKLGEKIAPVVGKVAEGAAVVGDITVKVGSGAAEISGSIAEGVQGAATAKVAEVQKNIEKTDFQAPSPDASCRSTASIITTSYTPRGLPSALHPARRATPRPRRTRRTPRPRPRRRWRWRRRRRRRLPRRRSRRSSPCLETGGPRGHRPRGEGGGGQR